jgi:hypothetical protein
MPQPKPLVFEGLLATTIYRAGALKAGLNLFRKTKTKPNRDWTPTAMLRAAGEITGRTYVRGQYKQAADDLEAWIYSHVEAPNASR